MILWREHALLRMAKRGITVSDVRSVLKTGIVIETFEDSPLPSRLVLGFDTAGDPIHVLVRERDDELCIFTAYRPSDELWEADHRTRKRPQ
ncbi:MAG: DUF4258 domain-containing protein [Sphaerochaetaceae bacterium]|jgi:hypothetical protein